MHIYKYMYINVPFYLQMSENITQQRDISDTVIFRFLQIFYRLSSQESIQTCLVICLLTDP